MKYLLIFALAAFAGTVAPAQQSAPAPAALDIRPAAGLKLEDFLWQNRLLVVFADSERDPKFQQQLKLLRAWPGDLLERDVIVITDTAPRPPSAIRQRLRPHGFDLVFVDKDGQIKLRKPSPWEVREISRSIDKTDLRQQELREARQKGSR